MNKYVVVGFVAMVVDRLTKLWALQSCTIPYVVTSWCCADLAFNQGMAWSIGASCSPLVLQGLMLFLTCLVCVLVVGSIVCYKKLAYSYAFSLIASGAISNVMDRWMYGGVIDFIVVHYHEWCWPTFNVADMAICIGVFLLLYEEIRT